MNQQAMSTLGAPPMSDGVQGAESRNDRIRQRIYAVLLFLHQRIGLRRLVGFLVLFAVIVAAAWWGLNMGQVPVPRQEPAPNIESAAQSQPDEATIVESPSEESPSDVSLSDASSPDASLIEASPSAGDSATGVAPSSTKKSRSQNTRRKAKKTTRKAKQERMTIDNHIYLMKRP